MNEKSLEEILESLAWIGLNKRLMPLGMAGWVNCLGLHVQLKEDGQRVLAGGMWRSYIDAVTSPDGEWQVRKFDKATWSKRFAHILEPTLQISVFLMECADERGLHGESERVYWETIRHYRSTGEWLGLTATQEMRAASMSRREHERLQKWAAAHERVSSLIPELESRASEDPGARIQPGGTQGRLHELYVELLALKYNSLERFMTKEGLRPAGVNGPRTRRRDCSTPYPTPKRGDGSVHARYITEANETIPIQVKMHTGQIGQA